MRTIKIAAALSILTLALPLPVIATSANAATAHNSQAGANGGTSNATAPTGRHMKRMKHTKHM